MVTIIYRMTITTHNYYNSIYVHMQDSSNCILYGNNNAQLL